MHHLGHLADLRDAVAHFERRGRAVRDVRAVRGHQPDLLVIDVDAMRHRDVRVENPEFVEVHHRPLTEGCDESLGVDLGRRHVKRHAGAILISELLGRFPQRIAARRMADDDRPGAQAPVVVVTVHIELTLQERDGLVGVLLVDGRLGRQIPHPATDASSNADLAQPFDHVVEKADGAGLQETRRARPQHLDGRELRRQSLFRGVVRRVERAEPDEHILFERRVVRNIATREWLSRDVDMGVHQNLDGRVGE